MKAILAALVFTILIFSGSIAAANMEIPFEKFQLDNGLTVIIHEDRKAPVVGVSMVYNVGSKDEPEGKSGFAHLFEHLMFTGSENYDDEWRHGLEEIGAISINGGIDLDRTSYTQTVPTLALERVLWMESDRMGHLLGAITQEKLDRERSIVQNEKRMGENGSFGGLWDSIFPALYPTNHPYQNLPAGSMDDLNAATLEDVKVWFRTYYGPSNAVLVLAGDVNAREARPLVEKYFGNIKPGPQLTKWRVWAPKRQTNTRVTAHINANNPRISRFWIAPPSATTDFSDLRVAAAILGEGENSRLYKVLVIEQQIATYAAVLQSDQELASTFRIVVNVKPGEDVRRVEREIDHVLADFLAEGPTEVEVERAVMRLKTGHLSRLQTVHGQAQLLAKGERLTGDPSYWIKTKLDEIEAATTQKVLAASREWLSAGWHQHTAIPYPDYKASGANIDRSTGLPEVPSATPLDFPAVEQATLSNGMKVYVVKRSVPITEIALRFDAGYAVDQVGKQGLAAFATHMLRKGAGDNDALEYEAKLDLIGATIKIGSDLDATTIRLTALGEKLSESLSLLSDTVRQPAFLDADIEREKEIFLDTIQSEKATPIQIGYRLVPMLLYDEGHAYRMPLSPTAASEEGIAEITRKDIVAFKDNWLRPDNSSIFVVGDMTMAEIRPLLERSFGDWRAEGEKPVKNIAAVSPLKSPHTLLIDRPGSSQSFIFAGQVTPSNIQSNLAMKIVDEILGAGLSSRLNLNLREDKGWAYAVRSHIYPAAGQGPYLVIAPVQTDKTGLAILELKKELKGIKSDRPVTAEELDLVKLRYARSLSGRFQTSSSVLDSLLYSSRFGLPVDYPIKVLEEYRALTINDVQAAAEAFLAPDPIVWVIIGDVEKIRADVEAAGVGPVEVIRMRDL